MNETQQESGLTLQAFRMRVLLIIGIAIAATAAVLFLPPITQETAYHNFADQRSMLAVPNMQPIPRRLMIGPPRNYAGFQPGKSAALHICQDLRQAVLELAALNGTTR